jgi:NAD(P)-dependent dehydrogenase (short-subunit alcohol dehydrogenase family)
VRDPASHADLVALALDTYGSLDMAFNNAGVPPPLPLHEVPPENLDLIFDVDIKGVFYAMQAQIRHFLRVGGGRSSIPRRLRAWSPIPTCRTMWPPSTPWWA